MLAVVFMFSLVGVISWEAAPEAEGDLGYELVVVGESGSSSESVDIAEEVVSVEEKPMLISGTSLSPAVSEFSVEEGVQLGSAQTQINIG
jgi:hypothetical protein